MRLGGPNILAYSMYGMVSSVVFLGGGFGSARESIRLSDFFYLISFAYESCNPRLCIFHLSLSYEPRTGDYTDFNLPGTRIMNNRRMRIRNIVIYGELGYHSE